jgi:hypothetical protein
MIQANMPHQKNYIKNLYKQFYEFKLIEIMSDQDVKEHLSFVFPHYEVPPVTQKIKEDSDDSDDNQENKQVDQRRKNPMQHLFFSEDMQFMLEMLSNARVFMYRRVHMRDRTNDTRVRWELYRRFKQFPTDLQEITQYPYIFSPDFSMYLDVDRKNKVFLIKDSFTQEVKVELPEDIMSCQHEPIKIAASRFMWTSNDTLKIINSEGVERRI